MKQSTSSSDERGLDGSVTNNATNNENVSGVSDESGWWRVGFHRAIDEDKEPLWYLDALIAYKVIRPVLEQQQLDLWRFHRRAVNDASGHQFSFIFYTTRSKGREIYQTIREDSLVKQLLQESVVTRLSFADINGKALVNVEDTSDKNWSIELQKAWPAFIMGVSQTWLDLIGEYAKQTPDNNEQDLSSLLERFELINSKINFVWEMEGNHAFLHHLNALFGYQELYIIERKKTRF